MTREQVNEMAKQWRRKEHRTCVALLLAVCCFILLNLMVGNTNYTFKTVIDVLMGHDSSGANFIITELRLPRATLGALAGFAFGVSGTIFQRMLRNPLASPDVLGISSASSVAAVFCILILRQSGNVIFLISVLSALSVSAIVYFCANIKGYSITKVVLIGIAVQAMLRSIISYMQIKANVNDLTSIIRWLSGDLGTATMQNVRTLSICIILIVPIILLHKKELDTLEYGEAIATTLGINTVRARGMQLFLSVTLLSVATAMTGPIAFVSFVAGPIAKKMKVSSICSAGFVGANIVLISELIGQNLFHVKMPVGVVTGVVGAPYLIYLIIGQRKEGVSNE